MRMHRIGGFVRELAARRRMYMVWLGVTTALAWLAGCSFPTEDVPRRSAAEVTHVVDGDTLDVRFGDGTEERIRLLLVDTPETVDPRRPVQPFGPEASAFAKEELLHREVEVELDVSERDKYQRLLAYIWVDGRLFNELLLEEGLARVAYVFEPNVKYVDRLRDAQDVARKQGVGIWSVENYASEDGFRAEALPSERKAAPSANAVSDYYARCADARAAGAAPLYEGDAAYRPGLDGDGDGIACE
ncbi:thermonuclease family protein [Paenibacillus sp. TRM 82003]|nr:thermonuclease family protein [Paenibacillus sp. TRM 82003]